MSGGLQLTKLKLLWQSEHYLLIRAFTIIAQNQHREVCSYSGLPLLFAHTLFPLFLCLSLTFPSPLCQLVFPVPELLQWGKMELCLKDLQTTTKSRRLRHQTRWQFLSVLDHFTTMDSVAHSHLHTKITKWIYMKLEWRMDGSPKNGPLTGLDPDKGKNLGLLSHFL